MPADRPPPVVVLRRRTPDAAARYLLHEFVEALARGALPGVDAAQVTLPVRLAARLCLDVEASVAPPRIPTPEDPDGGPQTPSE